MHPVSLTCATCHQEFSDSWDLCRHCQSCHGIHIYADSVEDNQSVTSDSVCSGGTSETQGSAGHSDVSTGCCCSYTQTVLESFSLPNFARNKCLKVMILWSQQRPYGTLYLTTSVCLATFKAHLKTHLFLIVLAA